MATAIISPIIQWIDERYVYSLFVDVLLYHLSRVGFRYKRRFIFSPVHRTMIKYIDTYRQQAWPLLLEEQEPHDVSPYIYHPINILSNRNGSSDPGATTHRSQKITSPPISPCSVIMPTTTNMYTNHGGHDETVTTLPPPHNSDTTIMWFDVQRYDPSLLYGVSSSLCWSTATTEIAQEQLVEDFRGLLLHVMEESLCFTTLSPPQRYYQGYHIVAGLVLSTFLHPTRMKEEDYRDDDIYRVSYATTDTIAFLQQLIRTVPVLSEMVIPHHHDHDDSLPRMVQLIRQTIFPLYSYYDYHHCRHHHNTSTNDLGDDDDIEQYMIGQCMTWILTLFGINGNQQYSDGPRYMDALLASHPQYFILYLCTSKLLWSSMRHHRSHNSHEECEAVIEQAIRIMEAIPPRNFPKVFAWYQRHRHSILNGGESPSDGDVSYYKDNVGRGGPVDSDTGTVESIQKILQYLYRSHYYHDAMITTATSSSCRNPTIRHLVRWTMRDHCVSSAWFVQLRRVARRLRKRSCRATATKYREWMVRTIITVLIGAAQHLVMALVGIASIIRMIIPTIEKSCRCPQPTITSSTANKK